MHSFEIDYAKGKRKCTSCKKAIPRGEKCLAYWDSNAFGAEKRSVCTTCGCKAMDIRIKRLQKMKTDLKKTDKKITAKK